MDDFVDGLGSAEAIVAAFRDSRVTALVVEGEDLVIRAVNEPVSRLLGGEREFLGRTCHEVFADLVAPGYLDLLRQVFDTGRSRTLHEWRVEHPLPGGGAMERYVNLYLTPWRRADGSVRGVVGQGVDVTEQVQSLRRTEAEAELQERHYREAKSRVHELQDRLLPHSLSVLPGLQIAGRYLLAESATSVGGDWLDAIPLPDGRVALVVGDVVGHGVDAAALMGQLRAVLGERLAAGVGIVAALEALDALARRMPEAQATTLMVAELDPRDGRLTYCTAGHPAPLVVSGTDSRFLPPTGARPLASYGGFPTRTDRLGPSDLLLLYTDGLIERPGRNPARATVELATVASRAAAGETGESGPAGAGAQAVDRVCAATLELLTRDTGYADDISVLAAQRVPVAESMLVRGAARPEVLQEVRTELDAWLEQFTVSSMDVMALQHAVGEAVSNVVEHAYPDGLADHARPVSVTADLDDQGRATLVVTDQGTWRKEGEGSGARGLPMINQLVDRVRVGRKPHSSTVTMEHRLTCSVPLMQAVEGSHPRAGHGDAFAAEVGDDGVRVRGAVDSGSADDFHAALLRAARSRQPVLCVDLSAVTLLASAGVQVLFDVLERTAEQGIELRLVAPPGSVAQHVLDLVRLPYDSGRGG